MNNYAEDTYLQLWTYLQSVVILWTENEPRYVSASLTDTTMIIPVQQNHITPMLSRFMTEAQFYSTNMNTMTHLNKRHTFATIWDHEGYLHSFKNTGAHAVRAASRLPRLGGMLNVKKVAVGHADLWSQISSCGSQRETCGEELRKTAVGSSSIWFPTVLPPNRWSVTQNLKRVFWEKLIVQKMCKLIQCACQWGHTEVSVVELVHAGLGGSIKLLHAEPDNHWQRAAVRGKKQ